jgi:hypothetical protein
MFEHGLRKTWMAVLLALATVAPASADGPKAGFKLDPEAGFRFSPDSQWLVNQSDRRAAQPSTTTKAGRFQPLTSRRTGS